MAEVMISGPRGPVPAYEDRSFTIALLLASPTAPSERITWTTGAS